MITSPANSRVKRALKLRKSRERRGSGLFLAEGWREISRAMEAGLEPQEVFVCSALESPPNIQALHEALAKSNPHGQGQMVEVEQSLFTRMTYRRHPEGMLAVFGQPDWTLEEVPTVNDQTLLLVAVGTAKPGNLGAMVRTADAAGATAVLSPDLAVDPYHPNAIRASTGAVFSMPMVQAQTDRVIRWLDVHHVRIAAATPHAALSHTQADLTGALAVVIGPEDFGLSQPWLDAAPSSRAMTSDQVEQPGTMIRIPTRGTTADSLNASNAAAIVLFEALRQRGGV